MTFKMEDDNYRTSSQYRLWSFTPENLSEIRTTTNQAAETQVRAAFQRAREKKRRLQKENLSSSSEGDTPGVDKEKETSTSEEEEEKAIECLTPEEELKLVRYYCRMIMEIAQHVFEFPTNVKATAATYLRRFFTRTSPMTYHPKTLLYTILWLTTKTENHYVSLSSFSAKLPKTTPEEILAPEFVIAMGLGWCFEVKHPYRGLVGCIMELNKVCDGQYIAPPIPPTAQAPPPQPTAAEWQAKLHALPSPPTTGPSISPKQRVERAHGKARAILMFPALLTDAYFLFTPPQLYLAAIYIVDPALCLFFIDLKLRNPAQAGVKDKLIATVERCAEELHKGGDPSAPISKEELDEATRIDRKLYFCRNPEKVDLMSLNKIAKRGGTLGDGNTTSDADESKQLRDAKKRKVEREKVKQEGQDLFGGGLKK